LRSCQPGSRTGPWKSGPVSSLPVTPQSPPPESEDQDQRSIVPVVGSESPQAGHRPAAVPTRSPANIL